MNATEKRVKDMHDAGFSTSTIYTNLKQQGHAITMHKINVILNAHNKPYEASKYVYQVNTASYTFRTTEAHKNRYHAIAEMLNNGLTRNQIATNLGLTKGQVSCSIKHHIVKKKIT